MEKKAQSIEVPNAIFENLVVPSYVSMYFTTIIGFNYLMMYYLHKLMANLCEMNTKIYFASAPLPSKRAFHLNVYYFIR